MKPFSYISAGAAALSICFALNTQAAQPVFSGAFEDAPFFSPITVGEVLFLWRKKNQEVIKKKYNALRK